MDFFKRTNGNSTLMIESTKLRALSALVPYVLSSIMCLVPYMFYASHPSCSICCCASSVSFSTFFRASHSSCSTSFVLHLPLSLWCSRARHILLTSGVSFPIYSHGSHLLALMYRVSCVLVFQISEFFPSLDYRQSI